MSISGSEPRKPWPQGAAEPDLEAVPHLHPSQAPKCSPGTTVLILAEHGAEAILGKCRCDAGFVLAWFLDPAHRNPVRFEHLWQDFIVPRMWGCQDRCQDIESTFSDTGYRFSLRKPVGDLPVHQLIQALQGEGERQLRRESGWDGLLEAYGTAQILVDLRGWGSVRFHRMADES